MGPIWCNIFFRLIIVIRSPMFSESFSFLVWIWLYHPRGQGGVPRTEGSVLCEPSDLCCLTSWWCIYLSSGSFGKKKNKSSGGLDSILLFYISILYYNIIYNPFYLFVYLFFSEYHLFDCYSNNYDSTIYSFDLIASNASI